MELTDTETFRSVSYRLSDHGYRELQYVPGNYQAIGAELDILRASMLKEHSVLLRGSRFYDAYRRRLKRRRPVVHELADMLFDCRRFSIDRGRHLLGSHELDRWMAHGVVSTDGDGLRSNLRFIPVDDLLIACSPERAYGTEEFVYIGSDTLVFQRLIAERAPAQVESALEIGCGSGYLSLSMAKRSRHVTAADISPGALTVTRLNAEMNGIENVEPVQSDVYSGAQARYDIILSNPPYMFLPEDKVGRLHADGGHLGMDITRRILLGLDAHLSPRGVAFIYSASYILADGTDTLCALLEELLGKQPWRVVATQLDYQPVHGDHDFYSRNRISHYVRYLVTICRADAFSLVCERLSPVARAVQRLKLRVAQRSRAGQRPVQSAR
jgi:SAM-dependent methyltransferase